MYADNGNRQIMVTIHDYQILITLSVPKGRRAGKARSMVLHHHAPLSMKKNPA